MSSRPRAGYSRTTAALIAHALNERVVELGHARRLRYSGDIVECKSTGAAVNESEGGGSGTL